MGWDGVFFDGWAGRVVPWLQHPGPAQHCQCIGPCRAFHGPGHPSPARPVHCPCQVRPVNVLGRAMTCWSARPGPIYSPTLEYGTLRTIWILVFALGSKDLGLLCDCPNICTSQELAPNIWAYHKKKKKKILKKIGTEFQLGPTSPVVLWIEVTRYRFLVEFILITTR